MKKIITLFFLCAPAILLAQGVGVGIKAGVNFANVDAEDVSTKSITSFHAGVYANLNLTDKFGVTPELLWTGYGSEVEDVKFETTYISVPVMLRYKLIPLLHIEAGPQFNFLTKAEFDGDDYKDQLKKNDISACFGAGVNLPMGFNGGLRYVLGLSNISDVEDVEIKNRVLQIYVGWTLFGAK